MFIYRALNNHTRNFLNKWLEIVHH